MLPRCPAWCRERLQTQRSPWVPQALATSHEATRRGAPCWPCLLSLLPGAASPAPGHVPSGGMLPVSGWELSLGASKSRPPV